MLEYAVLEILVGEKWIKINGAEYGWFLTVFINTNLQIMNQS